MTLNAIRLISAVFTAVAMAGGFAHLLELPNKVKLSREGYLCHARPHSSRPDRRGCRASALPLSGSVGPRGRRD